MSSRNGKDGEHGVATKEIKPDDYREGGKDLLQRFEEGLLAKEETVGFYKGNIIKYLTRFEQKNGIEDLIKAQTYLDRLIEFETKHVSTSKTD